MPDNVRPPRNPRQPDAPTLLAARIMTEVYELIRERHKTMRGHRVVYKTNDRGEHVISLVFPPQS